MRYWEMQICASYEFDTFLWILFCDLRLESLLLMIVALWFIHQIYAIMCVVWRYLQTVCIIDAVDKRKFQQTEDMYTAKVRQNKRPVGL